MLTIAKTFVIFSTISKSYFNTIQLLRMQKNLLASISFLYLFFCCSITNLYAHSPNQSILFLQVHEHEINGRFEISIKDLNKLLPNQPLKQGLSTEDLTPHKTTIESYILQQVSISSSNGQALTMKMTGSDVYLINKALGDYVRVNFDLEGLATIPDDVLITYKLLFDQDPSHQGAVVIEHNWKTGLSDNEQLIALIFTQDNISQRLDLTDRYLVKGLLLMLKLGIKHILIGLDHILFLLALILPSVIIRKQAQDTTPIRYAGQVVQMLSPHHTTWYTFNRFRPAFFNILKVVTFFTLAHTITLSLAALEVMQLPSKLVESIIAFSIALAAFHNIRPIFKAKEWMIAFIFGLFHGFGFASVLGDYGINDFLAYSLLGFNVGVEIGQLFILALLFPIIFLVRKSRLFPKILVYGSVILIIIAFYWVVGRVFELDLPGDDIIVQLYRFLKSLIA